MTQSIFKGLVYENGIWHQDELSGISYPEHGNQSCFQVEEQSFWFKHRNAIISELLKAHANGSTFLDVGGGNGFVARAIQERGYDVVLLEPGEWGCINARNRGVKHIVHGVLDEKIFEAGSFENIGMFDVLEHIEDRRTFLANARRLLPVGGKLFATVPALPALWSDEDLEAGHFLRYTRKSLSEEIEKAGFIPRYTTYFFSLLLPPLYLMRALPHKLGIQKKRAIQNDHKSSGLINEILSFEIKRVRKGQNIPSGTSVLMVAEKG